MIAPIMPYTIQGATWYQGESNADDMRRAYQYRELFPLMIRDWREKWDQGDFPFLYVQLANFLAPDPVPTEDPWPILRESQTLALAVPNTGMALAIDIGEADDIHPTNKQEVGRRLALDAYKIAYNLDVVASGPMYESMEVNGNKVKIHFTHVANGLSNQNKYGYLMGFSVAGADKKFHFAKAKIIDKNTVEVYTDKADKIEAVRYAWANNPDQASLYNSEGLPAIPFRTDEWEMMGKE
jgi:sialate O-acetylesterase